MRYFLCMNASKPVTVSGRSFKFEAVGNLGGSCFGVFATDDESAANILASGVDHTLEEITEAQYIQKKKTIVATPSDSHGWKKPQPDSGPSLSIAEVAGRVTNLTFDRNGGPNSTEMVTPVTILSTKRQPPRELILEGAGQRKR